MEKVDVLIIGGGIVGLACAAESSIRGYLTVLVERNNSYGQETSSRNSEVIHSGIYYKPGSLKAKLCVTANPRLYSECEHSGVWARRCGKLIVATSKDEISHLETLQKNGIKNGVENIVFLESSEVQQMEPYIKCTAALFIPSTGIVDSHQLMKFYYHKALTNGAIFLFNTEYMQMEKRNDAYQVQLRHRDGSFENIQTEALINSAGLSSDKVAQSFGINIDKAGYRLHPNRGHYYRLSPAKSQLVSRLVYPVPLPNLVGVGIHLTIDKAGQCKLGPDNEYLNKDIPENQWYIFDESRKNKFFEESKKYFPSLEMDDLIPDQVGVRPKVQALNEPEKDFIIAEENSRGLPRVINLIGIESPGLTCAAEIAREVFDLLSK